MFKVKSLQVLLTFHFQLNPVPGRAHGRPRGCSGQFVLVLTSRL